MTLSKEELQKRIENLNDSFKTIEEHQQKGTQEMYQVLRNTGETLLFKEALESFHVQNKPEAFHEDCFLALSKVMRKMFLDIHGPKTSFNNWKRINYNHHPDEQVFDFTPESGSRWSSARKMGHQEMTLHEVLSRAATKKQDVTYEQLENSWLMFVRFMVDSKHDPNKVVESHILPGIRAVYFGDKICFESYGDAR